MNQIYTFDNITFDPATSTLLRAEGGQPLVLRAKTAALLTYFLNHQGMPLERDRLLAEVWEEEIVSTHCLTQSISELRKALKSRTEFIRTLPKKGYQWLPPVSRTTREITAQPVITAEVADPPRSPRLKLLLIAGLLVILLAWFTDFLRHAHTPVAAPDRAEPVRIALLPIANETGDTDLDWVRFGLLEMALSYLNRTEPLVFVQPEEIIPYWLSHRDPSTEALAPERLDQLKEAFGVDAVIQLSIFTGRDGRAYALQGWYDDQTERNEVTVALNHPLGTLDFLPVVMGKVVPYQVHWTRPEEFFQEDDFVNRSYALGLSYFRQNAFVEAKPFFESCLVRASAFHMARIRLATCLREMGMTAEAEATLHPLLGDDFSAHQPIIRARALAERGLLFRSQGAFDEAVCHLEDALAIAEAHLDPFALATLHSNIGSTLIAWQRSDLALPHMVSGLQLAEQWHFPFLVYVNTTNLANFYMHKGDRATSESLNEQALVLITTLGNEQQIVGTMENLALFAFYRNDLERAETFCLDALAIYRQANRPLKVAGSLGNLGYIYDKAGRQDEALKVLAEAVALFEQYGQDHALATTHLQFANIYLKQEQHDKAKDHLLQALSLAESLDDGQLVATLNRKLQPLDSVKVERSAEQVFTQYGDIAP